MMSEQSKLNPSSEEVNEYMKGTTCEEGVCVGEISSDF